MTATPPDSNIRALLTERAGLLAARDRLLAATDAAYNPPPGTDRFAALGELAAAERAVIDLVKGLSR